MEIIAAKIERYSVPLARELTIKGGKLKFRRGALLFFTDSNGVTGCGELAPLETLHKESLEDAISQLDRIKDDLVGTRIPQTFAQFTEGIDIFLPFATYPSVACAIETAILDIFKHQGAFDDLKEAVIEVNALVSADIGDLCYSAMRLVDQGFRSVKVKVGRVDVESEIAAVKKLCGDVKGRATLRLDANREWSLKTALEFCEKTACDAIEYIEEPLNDISKIPAFTEKSKIPIALDETLVEKTLEEIKKLEKVSAFVLKPSVIGGLKKTADLIRHAKQNDITPVISSAFESSVSLKAYSILAAKMGLGNIPHGLDTLKFLVGDTLNNPLAVSNCKIYLKEIIESKNIIKTAAIARSSITEIEIITDKLKKAGIKPNDRIGILCDNSSDYVRLVLALWNTGAVVVPISTRYKPKQVWQVIETASCKKVFGNRECEHTDLYIEDFVNAGTDKIEGLAFDDFNFDLQADASIIFTSSSTGKPKAVLHTIANHYYSAVGSNENIPFQEGDGWLMCLPMYHISGFSLIMRALVGMAAIIFPELEMSLSEAIRNPDVTHISLVAAQLSKLLESDESIRRLQKFKAILVGGSAIPQGLIKRALEYSLPIFTTYGSTETASQVTTTRPGELQTRIESSGRVLPFREMKLTDDGEILVKGKTLFKGYVKKDSLDLPVDWQGWFHTNDIGVVDCDGCLAVTGRKDLMFISGGENIHPQQIERHIERIPGVERAIVVPKDDEKFCKVPAAFIKMQKDVPLDVKKIQTELRKHLESFKIPKTILPWPMEISESMKPDRQSLMKYL